MTLSSSQSRSDILEVKVIYTQPSIATRMAVYPLCSQRPGRMRVDLLCDGSTVNEMIQL